ncbi:MAG TPA: imidazolonepropionase, partial [Spirochaetales bacterium]|nr:imidazolonepropionase [Spirochaetales bacterium]
MENKTIKATTLVTNIGQLATPQGKKARKGTEIGTLNIIENASIAINIDTIVWIGHNNDLPEIEGNLYEHIDVQGKAVIPGFVDSHTHFVFAGSRVDEFVW